MEALQERAVALGGWLALLAVESTRMVGTLNGHVTAFSEGLGRCTNIDQVIDLIIGQVSDLTGMPRVTVQEIRDALRETTRALDNSGAHTPDESMHAMEGEDRTDRLSTGNSLIPGTATDQLMREAWDRITGG